MKLLCLVLSSVLIISAGASPILAQSHFSHKATTIALESHTPAAARDFWFAFPQNNDPNDDAGKRFAVYISSLSQTTAYIQISGQPQIVVNVPAGGYYEFLLPTTVEIATSDIVEKDKAIHVWSEGSDITVFVLSANPFSSDGFMAIPRIFWDTVYVVTSYSALIIDPRFDLPSEFCIVADADNTVITIRPSQDIRQAGDPKKVGHAKGLPFRDTLQRGECIQYQTVFDLGGSDLDLTGTVVTSTKPIGVIGASACPFIPNDPYCDHICEMLLPVSRWGTKYYTLPLADRGSNGTFYVIGSKQGQTIFRNGDNYATVNTFESFFRSNVGEPSIWTSDAPFMLVQYSNGGAGEFGDPAMVEINPAEFGRRDFTIQLSNGIPNQMAFRNYLHIFVPKSAISSLYIDTIPVLSYPNMTRYSIQGTTWEGIELKRVSASNHRITCDSPVTAYGYGYAVDHSYAWSVLGPEVKVVLVKDSTPPVFVAQDSCNCTTIALSDNHANASKIVSIAPTSRQNLDLTIAPSFIQGKTSPTSWYTLCDTAGKTGSATMVITDSLGNSTTLRSSYIPHFTRLEGADSIIVVLQEGTTRDTMITITNLTSDTLKNIFANLVGGGRYEFIPDLPNGLPDLPPHGSVTIIIRFLGADTALIQKDTILYSYDSCEANQIFLTTIVEPAGGVDIAYSANFMVNSLVKNRTLVIEHSSNPATLEVYDIVGKLWYATPLTATTQKITEEIRLPSSMLPGSYIVRYTSRGYVKSQVIQIIE